MARESGNPVPHRKPLLPPGGRGRLGDGRREDFNALPTLDSLNPRLPASQSRIKSQYQSFRRTCEGPDSFYCAFGIALLEHYCRKTTPMDEFENMRKWMKSQNGTARCRPEVQEECKTMEHVFTVLSEDKRNNPGLTLYQLQNLFLVDSFYDVLVKFVRMVVINTIEMYYQNLKIPETQVRNCQEVWMTEMVSNDTVMQAAAWGFGVNLRVEDCAREYVRKDFGAGVRNEYRAVLTVLRYRLGFVVAYAGKVGLIDGYSNGEFSTNPATEQENQYARENYGNWPTS